MRATLAALFLMMAVVATAHCRELRQADSGVPQSAVEDAGAASSQKTPQETVQVPAGTAAAQDASQQPPQETAEVPAGAATASGASQQPQQWIIASCYKIPDTAVPSGKLCITQLQKTNVTKVVCGEFKPECVQTVTEERLVTPEGNARTNPVGFMQSAGAACRLLGYKAPGDGSIHITGDTPSAKALCWNGKEWQQDNWWLQLTCCD